MESLCDDSMIEIMTNLEYKDILSVCLSSKSKAGLFNNEQLWRMVMERDFGERVMRFKPEADSFREQCRYLMGKGNGFSDDRVDKVMLSKITGNSIALAARSGSLNVLKWLHSEGYVITTNYISRSIVGGQIETVMWIVGKYGLVNSSNLTTALKHNRLDIYRKLKGRVKVKEEESLAWALHHPNFEEAEELLHLICDGTFHHIIKHGNIQALEWLQERDYLPIVKDYEVAINNDRGNVLRWMIRNGVPTEDLRRVAERANLTDVLKILDEEGV